MLALLLSPVLLLLIGASGWAVWKLSLRKLLISTAAAFIVYGAYELIYIPYACPGECNIRVDLLVIWPILLLLLLGTLFRLIRLCFKSKPSTFE